jgi:large subunit ribosomal protein L21
MPKLSKSSKKLQHAIQKKLEKLFVKSGKHETLMTRIEALEKELGELRQMVGGSLKAEKPAPGKPAEKRAVTKKPVARKTAAPKVKNSLQGIKGIGAVIEKKLLEYGVNSIDQIAAWSDKDVDDFSQRLNFKGRIEREKWVEQAKELLAS